MAKLFTGPLAVLYWGVGLWGFILTAQYIYAKLGVVGVIVSIVILPLSYIIAPIWAGFADGYWLPAMVSFAPMVAMMAFSVLATFLERR